MGESKNRLILLERLLTHQKLSERMAKLLMERNSIFPKLSIDVSSVGSTLDAEMEVKKTVGLDYHSNPEYRLLEKMLQTEILIGKLLEDMCRAQEPEFSDADIQQMRLDATLSTETEVVKLMKR